MNLTCACASLALASLIAAQAQPATTTTEASANASFAYMSDDGCVETEVVLFANRTTVVSAKAPSTTSEVMYSRHRYDYCDNSDLSTDLGSSLRPVFSGDLNRAALNVTINGASASGSVAPVSFELVWEGKGGTTRMAVPRKTSSGNIKVIRNEKLTRNAAVTGTVDGQSISGAVVTASLHTTRKTISH